jgi:hypothetical protein
MFFVASVKKISFAVTRFLKFHSGSDMSLCPSIASKKCSTSLMLSIARANFGRPALQGFRTLLKFLNLAVIALAGSW